MAPETCLFLSHFRSWKAGAWLPPCLLLHELKQCHVSMREGAQEKLLGERLRVRTA